MQFLLANESNSQNLKDIRLGFEIKDANLEEVFTKLESVTQFKFGYDRNILKSKVSFTFNERNTNVEDILLEIAEKASLRFKRINDQILVLKDDQENDGGPKIEVVQDKTVTGKVTDSESGEPIIGATILVKGTTIGTVSDIEGQFQLSIPADAETLVVSFVGYKTQELSVLDQSTFEVQMAVDAEQLEEVIVYGYGTATKEKFNGAVSKVESKQLNSYSTANFEQSLVGNIPGIQIMQNTKNPGESSVVQIRGISTLTAGTDPLLVVDGVPLTEGSSLSSINTRDIESVNVLKDAASSAIYGSRASNGVILITTKKGTKGKPVVTYDGYFGVNAKIDDFELVDAYDAAIFHYEARNNGYVSKDPENRSVNDDNATRLSNGAGKRELIPTYLQDYLDKRPGLTNTDWEDEVYRKAKQQSHYINIRGGSENTDYSVSLGYYNQENTVIHSDYERYSVAANVNTKLSDYVKYGLNINTAFANTNLTDTRAWADLPPDPGFAFTLMDPYYPVHNANGSLAIAVQLDDHNQNWDGPIAENVVAHAAFTKNFQSEFRTFGSTYFEIQPIEGLKFKSSLGGDYRTTFRDYFSPSFLGRYRRPVASNPASAFQSDAKAENFLNENILTYFHGLGDHGFNVLIGQSFQKETTYFTQVDGTDFVDDNLDNISGASNFSVDNQRSVWSLSSLFSRLEYDYSGKYFISAAVRRDGSSRFGSASRFATFSAFSGGWAVSEENFFPKNDLLNYAKLRITWGQSGNNQIGDFSSQSLLEPDNYTIDGQLVGGTAISTAPNDRLSWETSTSTNYGFDFGLFESKILLTAEYYVAVTEDLLLNVPVPQQTGYSTSLQNVGELENKGFELSVRGNNFNFGDLKIGFNANLATNKNEVLALGKGQNQIIAGFNGIDFLTKVGEPIAQFYAYEIIGVFKSQAEIDAATSSGVIPLAGTMVGDYIVRDANGDGEITPDDRITLGDYNPELTYGIGFNLDYKGFDLLVQFDGINGRKLYDRMLRNAEAGEGFVIPSQYYFDNYWHPTRNPNGFFAAPNFGNFSSARRPTRASSLSVLDADYFRLRSLQIGYTLPDDLVEKVGMTKARVYFTGNNLFHSTNNYRGLSSEAIREGNILTRGVNYTGTPTSRFIALGITANF